MKNTWPVEDDNVALEKMTRRVEHVMDILAASNKYLQYLDSPTNLCSGQ